MRAFFLALIAVGSSACFTFIDFDLGDGGGGAAQGGAGAAGGHGAAGGASESGGAGGMDACEGSQELCGGGCVDTSSDANHCGACDHDCGGGLCGGGVCQPVELASHSGMHGLLLDQAGSRVFFATSDFNTATNAVGVVSTQTGAVDLFSENQPAASYLAQGGSHLYFTTWDEASVRSIDLSQPGVPTIEIGLSGGGFGMRTGPSGDVFYCDYALGLFSFDPTATPVVAVPSVQAAGIHHFVFDSDGSIVFTVAASTSTVERYNPSTGMRTTLATSDDPWDIVQDDAFFYFSDQATGTLQRIAKPGGAPAQLMAGNLSAARGLAVDEDYVYVVSGTAVTRVAKVPPHTATFVTGAQSGNAIAVDGDFIYWTNIGTGKLMKVAKPL